MLLMLEFIKTILYYPFVNLITFFIWLVPGHNAAWGIIFLTLIVRFALLVPSKKAAQAQRRLQEMAPLIEELKLEYGNDKQGMAQAQMELYKQNNINPFGSCVPLLIQFPVLIILYQAILHGLTPNNPGLYAWLPRPDHVQTIFLGIDLLKVDRFYVFAIIAGALQFVQMRMVMPKTPKDKAPSTDPAQAMQKQMMYLFPLLTLYVAGRFPAGVALYWVITTAFSIVQQYYVNKEKLKVVGVKEALAEADVLHPEHKNEDKALKEELVEELEQTTKKGVSITVRRKSKK